MPNLSKLEVFKLILGRTTFREVAISKCGLDEAQVTNNQIFNSLCELLLQKLCQNSVWTNDKTKLGLALFTNAGETVNTVLSPHSESCVIEGYIDGGPYDRIRRMAEKDNTANKTIVGRDKIVTDRYYLYLYMPLGSSIGLLFLEKKKGQDIHTPMGILLNEVLKIRNNIKVERYVPKYLIDEYRTEGIIDSITFSDSMVSPELGDDNIVQQENGYDISISIKSKSGEQQRKFDLLDDLLNCVGNIVVQVGTQFKNLSQFGNKKARIRKNQDSYNFVIGEDMKIRPSVEIEEHVHDREHDILLRAEAYRMTNDLLELIKPDVYPIQEEEI